jgi:1-acyl-sn-glycerol-3-phosphate acyltransferase
MTAFWLVLSAPAAAGLGWWLLLLLYRAGKYVRKVSRSGYLSDPPSEKAVRWATRISKIVAFIWIGKVEVFGIEHLDSAGTPVMILPNHSHGGDPFVMPMVLNRPMRYMAGAGFMRVLGLLVASMGAYSIDVWRRRGKVALDASVQLLVSGQSILMFPEGELFLPVGPFKSGAVRIAFETAERIGKPVTIVPVCLRYGRYPGKWVHHLPDYIRYSMPLYNPFWYRRGVKVVFGQPFSSDELPADLRAASEILRQKVAELDPQKIT